MDPDLAFHSDADPDPTSQKDADPDSQPWISLYHGSHCYLRYGVPVPVPVYINYILYFYLDAIVVWYT